MLKKPSPDQLKIGLALAFALYVANGQANSTAAKTNQLKNDDRPAAVALSASTTPAIAVGSGGCRTAQRQVQVPADAVLNLRSYANGPVVSTIAPGATVTAQRRDGAWSEVITASGQSGWAFSQYLGCR